MKNSGIGKYDTLVGRHIHSTDRLLIPSIYKVMREADLVKPGQHYDNDLQTLHEIKLDNFVVLAIDLAD